MVYQVRFFVILLLAGCSTSFYSPQNYSIYDRNLADFTTSGEVSVISVNEAEPPIVITSNGTKYEAELAALSEKIAQQVSREIHENSTIDGNTAKSLYIQLENAQFSRSQQNMQLQIQLLLTGDRGFLHTMNLDHLKVKLKGQPTERAFDELLALSVKAILTDSYVLRYLHENSF